MTESAVPPGFRFHPTEEELVGYYLKRKISSLKIDLNLITDIDLYNMEPWDIQDRCGRVLGNEVEQKEWYFFSHKDKKYPTGTRTNRATAHGFWKATGRDKAVLSRNNRLIIGMRKTLVFYRGRAPNGRKTDWIIHEYRLQTSELVAPPQEEGWVVCRAFKKPIPNERPGPGVSEAYYAHNGVQIRHDEYCTPDHYVTPLFPNQDFYFQQSIVSSTLGDEISREAQGLPPLLDIPTPATAISDSDGQLMKQLMASHQRGNCPWFEDYDMEGYGEWKALNSLLITATEPSSGCSINSDINHHASNPIMSPRDRVAPAASHQNQG